MSSQRASVCAAGVLAELVAAEADLSEAYDIVQNGIYGDPAVEPPVSEGWWCEGGWLDALDKSISLPLFRLELPLALEVAWSAPGAWFGVPVVAQGVAPLVIAAVVDHCAVGARSVAWTASPLVRFAMAPALLLLVLWWGRLVKEMLAMRRAGEGGEEDFKQRRGIRAAYHVFKSKGMTLLATVAAPHVALALTSKLAGPSGHAAAAFYSVAWALAVMPSEMLKGLFKRQRPAYCLRGELGATNVHRRMEQMQALLRSSETRFKSFPSGDAAGAMAFCASGVLITSASLFARSDFLASVDALLTPTAPTGGAGGGASVAAAGASAGSALVALGFALAAKRSVLFFSACAVLSATGRMFFHAHHFMDVAVGQLCSLGTTLALWYYTQGKVTWRDAAIVHAGAILFFLAAERRLPSAPMKKDGAEAEREGGTVEVQGKEKKS